MKWASLWPVVLFAASTALAQTSLDVGRQSRNVDFSGATFTKPSKTGVALPPTCSTGEMFFHLSAPAGSNLFGCIATNTWMLQAGGSGETNTASNVGSTGIGLFDAKSVTDLQFRKLNAASGKLTITLDNANRKLDFDVSTTNVLGAGSLSQLGSRNYTDLQNIPTTIVGTDRSNTYSSGTQDFGLATSFRIPRLVGGTTTTAGEIHFDSAGNVYKGHNGSAMKTFAFTDSNITGNASTATSLSGNPADCSAGQYASAIAANGDLTCAQVSYSQLSSVPSSFSPSTHASTHKHGGSDEVATATPAANAIVKANGSGKVAAGWMQEQIALADLSDVASVRGNSTQVQLTTGTVSANDCAKFDANGNLVSAGAACGSGGGGGSLTILTGGTTIGSRTKLDFDPGTYTTVSASDNGVDQVTATIDANPGALKVALAGVNVQGGTSYTVVQNDGHKLLTFSNASPVAVSLPRAGASGVFLSGWFAWFANRGAGLVTVTPATSTIDGAANISIGQNQSMAVFSDGTNYFTSRGMGTSGSGIVEDLSVVLTGYGSAISAGHKAFTRIPFACTLNSATLLADQSGSIAIDIKKSSYAGFPTTSSICTGGTCPSLVSAQKYEDSVLTNWTSAISAGDVLEVAVNSATTVKQVTVALKCTR